VLLFVAIESEIGIIRFGIPYRLRYSRYLGGEPELSGLGIIGTFDSDPDISELCPAIGDQRTLALAKTDLTKRDYMQSL